MAHAPWKVALRAALLGDVHHALDLLRAQLRRVAQQHLGRRPARHFVEAVADAA
jgi:hypothetical protein